VPYTAVHSLHWWGVGPSRALSGEGLGEEGLAPGVEDVQGGGPGVEIDAAVETGGLGVTDHQ
jgi:hypothetical protein